MDGAILLLSAADGPMPQTGEHILLRPPGRRPRAGDRRSSTKCDLVDDPDLIAAYIELETRVAEELLTKYGFDGRTASWSVATPKGRLDHPTDPIFTGCIGELLAALDRCRSQESGTSTNRSIMPIEGVHTIEAEAMVATGKIEQGVITVGQEG